MARVQGAGLEELLAQSDWLGRLARRMAGPDDAEDALQETWLAAQRSPPDPERPLGPWLAQVLRNLVRARWQTDQRRRKREQAQAALSPDREAAVDAVYERVELQRMVAQRVMALDEPIRIVLLLRYFEGHDSSRIAQMLGLPAGTVRWRLKQALDRLRADMDARFAGDRRAWSLILAPGVPIAPAAAPAPAAWLAAGLALVLGGALGVGLAVWTGRSGADRASAVPGVAEHEASSGAPQPGPAGPATGRPITDGAGGARSAALLRRAASGRSQTRPFVVAPVAEGAPAFAPALLSGAVRLRGEPEDAAVVVASPIDPLPTDLPPAHAKTDYDGRFQFDALPPGRYVLTATGHDEGTARSPEMQLGGGQAVHGVDLDLQPVQAGLAGHVLDPVAGGIARARVRARLVEAHRSALVFEAESGCLGRYTLQLLPGLYAVDIEADGYAPARFSLMVRTPLLHAFRLHPAVDVPTANPNSVVSP
jgi:RNA polymerase sigma-70 factor (ECF subfamily)